MEICPCEKDIDFEHSSGIQCDQCNQWWHTICLGIKNKQTLKKLEKSHYICPFCSVQNLKPDSVIKNKLAKLIEPIKPQTQKVDTAPQVTCSPQIDSLAGASEEHIVILDGIKAKKDFKNSAAIKKEINKQKPKINFSIAYSLAGGGIAIHCKDTKSRDLALKEWEKGAFGSEHIKQHLPSGNSPTQSVIARSVNIRLSEQTIKEEIEATYNTSVEVHRLQNIKSKQPFPLVKITADRPIAATFIEKGVSIQGQQHKCEVTRRVKPIRCFNCQRFGHCADTCLYTHKCVCCSGDHPPDLGCTIPNLCANCGGPHSADSNKCPVFLNLQKSLIHRHVTHGDYSPTVQF